VKYPAGQVIGFVSSLYWGHIVPARQAVHELLPATEADPAAHASGEVAPTTQKKFFGQLTEVSIDPMSHHCPAVQAVHSVPITFVVLAE